MDDKQIKMYELAEKGELDGLSLRDIAKLIGSKYPQSVKHRIDNLNKRGLLFYNPRTKVYRTTNHTHEFACIYCGMPHKKINQ